MTIGELLKEYRQKKGLTQKQFADGIVSTSYYSKVEKNEHRITVEDLVKILEHNDIAMWMKTVQQALDSTQINIKGIDDVPTIVNQNNTQINVNVEDNLSRESREKIMDALQAILGSVESNGQDMVLENDNKIQEDNIENNLGDIDNNGNKEDSSN